MLPVSCASWHLAPEQACHASFPVSVESNEALLFAWLPCVPQLVFAVMSPGAVLPNLVAGAIAEAGAQQAGDLMQVGRESAHLTWPCICSFILMRNDINVQ